MKWDNLVSYLKGFIKWAVLAVLVGAILGPIGGIFGIALNKITAVRESHSWLLYTLPALGAVIAALYHGGRQVGGGSTNAVFTAVRDGRLMPLRTAPLIFAATLLTHLGGGSSGREGAALQIGGSIGGKIGQLLKLDELDCRIMTMIGMSAGFSAIFGTPLAAAVFTLEVIDVGHVMYMALFPCLLAALVGVWISGLMGLAPTAFTLTVTAEATPAVLCRVVILGVLLAGLSIVFCELMHNTPKLLSRLVPNDYLRAVCGGVIVILLTLVCGTTDYNGAGGSVIAAAVAGTAVPAAFLLKMLFTAVTLGSGYKGGEIVPIFFTGAAFGCVAAPLLGLPAELGAAIGMVALFCGATNAPLASILLAAELFGGKCLPLFAAACAVSYMVSGYFSLYAEQKIVFSKISMEVIDKKLG